MAGLFAENWGWFTRAQMSRHWTIVSASGTISIGAYGSAGGPAVQFSGNVDDTIALPLTAASGATAILEVDVTASARPAATTPVLVITQGGAVQVSIYHNTAGTLSAYTGEGGGLTLLGTTAYVLPLSTRVRLGWKTLINGATGTVTLQAQGPGDTAPVSVLALTGQDTLATGSATWDGLRLSAACAGTTVFENLFVKDGSGGDNDDLSTTTQVVVSSSRPVADGAHSEFSRSTGLVQYAGVDDVTSDDDSSYNEADAVNEIDTMAMGDAPDPNQPIAFVMLAIVARNGGGTERLAPVLRQSSTDYVGTAVALGPSYAPIFETYDVSPAGSAWTPTIWNAIEAGYKRTT
jgi:hypothetical protein